MLDYATIFAKFNILSKIVEQIHNDFHQVRHFEQNRWAHKQWFLPSSTFWAKSLSKYAMIFAKLNILSKIVEHICNDFCQVQHIEQNRWANTQWLLPSSTYWAKSLSKYPMIFAKFNILSKIVEQICNDFCQVQHVEQNRWAKANFIGLALVILCLDSL